MQLHTPLVACLAMLAAGSAHAVTVTQWNFNSPVADGNPASGTLDPNSGSGSASLVGEVNGVFFTAADPADLNASSDPALSDNSGWHVSAFAAQGTGDRTRGVQFNVSTVGMKDVQVQYDFRPGRRAAGHHAFQISTDGVNFSDFATVETRQSETGCAWSNGISVDLASVLAANNNPNFAFRIVATFAPGTDAYAAARPSLTYADFANWRFDQVTVNAAPVPEAETYALMLAGLGLVSWAARRRQNAA